ncbi:MAG: hypothetical protein GWP67_04580 [Gammaproteobacteria bacterium]|jgi:hypothetical protein|nr:hypothetical protein [Gammaproteobacteria bacterium]
MKNVLVLIKIATVLAICSSLAGCDDVRVYGSVGYSGYSGYGGYHGGPRYGTSVTVGGRLY